MTDWLIFIAWAVGIGLVALFWDRIEIWLIERARRKYFERTERAWQQWYAQHPCKRSDVEPWLGTEQRKHAK